jgi:gluconokinase
LLARELDWLFADGDTFHPAETGEKMRRGIALNDQDRWPWLERVHAALVAWQKEHRNVVLACSALKNSYREILANGVDARFVYLRGGIELITARLNTRRGHFAGEEILSGQFRDLEEPRDAVCVDIAAEPETIVARIRSALKLSSS